MDTRVRLFSRNATFIDFGGIPVIAQYSTGAVVGLTERGLDLCRQFASGELSYDFFKAEDPQLLTCIEDGGFLTTSSGSQPRALRSAYLHVTQRCNLNCRGCYSNDSQRNNSKDAPAELIEHAIKELAVCGVQHLVISGGEPFLRSDLPRFVKYAAQLGIQSIEIITNGLCVDDSTLEGIAGIVTRVAVSFDGYNDRDSSFLRGSQRFNLLTGAVRRIQEHDIHAHMVVTIHSKNAEDLRRYAELAKKLGASLNFSLFSCDFSDGSLADLIPSESQLKGIAHDLLVLGTSPSDELLTPGSAIALSVKKNCGAGETMVSIGADGTIYPCHMLQRKEFALGNAFYGTVGEALNCETAVMLQQYGANKAPYCKTCSFNPFCGGGCRARAFFKNGDIEGCDPYCSMYSSFYHNMGDLLKTLLS